MAISTRWSLYNSTSNSTMNHHSFLHLKCTSVESPIGIAITVSKLFLVGRKEYEVPDENSNGIEIDECKTEEPTELVTERNSIMQKALDASNKASQNMVNRELWRNPPSLYYKGETVLIRVPVSKKLVKGKKNSLKNTCEGVILEANHSMHKYFISYNDLVTLESETRWF